MQLSLHGICEKYGNCLAIVTENSSEAEMIVYGFEIFLGSMMKIGFLLTTAILLGIAKEVAVLVLITGGLRTLSGGAHCTAYYRCMLTSTFVMITLGAIIKTSSYILTSYSVLYLSLLLATSIWLFWRYAPEAPLNKPLPDKAAEWKFRLLTIVLSIIFSAVSFAYGTGSWVSWAIGSAMLWQAVTLTGPGHKIVFLFDKILDFKKEV